MPKNRTSNKENKRITTKHNRNFKGGKIGCFLLLLLILLSLFGNVITTHDYSSQNLDLARIPPTVVATKVDNFFVFLSDVKNVVIYDGERYITPLNIIFSNDYKSIYFEFSQKSYTILVSNEFLTITCGENNYSQTKLIWNPEYPLGTDSLGRCFYSKLLIGLQITLIISIISSFFSFALGLLYGAISGYMNGILSIVMARVLDIVSVVPQLLIVILITSFLNASIIGMIIAISSVSWLKVARIVRGATIHQRNQPCYRILVEIGAPKVRMITKHVIPNVINLAAINTIALMPSIIISESSLSFIGLGLTGNVVSLGALCSLSLDCLYSSSYLTLIPMVILVVYLIAVSVITHDLKELG